MSAMTLKISVIGTGYLGAVHAACMADFGHEVVAIDVDADKIASLAAGHAPVYEPGLDELLARVIATGRLRFTMDYAEAADADVHFICVGTPQRLDDYAADTSYVFAAGEALAPHVKPGSVVVGKSTVPVGTAALLRRRMRQNAPQNPKLRVMWNPEFLREGHAVNDTMRPDRIVYGVRGRYADDDVALLDRVYAPILAAGTERHITDFATAELVKTAANAFLATKISFINAMAEICEATGADVKELARAIGDDDRIGHKFLGAGVGFGGGCLPKDIRAFMARGEELGLEPSLRFLREVDAINTRRRARMVAMAAEQCGGSLLGKRVAILGAAFKPDSDDIRDSPSLDIGELAKRAGADVIVHDPRAVPVARLRRPTLTYTEDITEAFAGADVVLHLTMWKDYRELDPAELKPLVRQPVIIDGRGALDPAVWRDAGWTFRAIGRPRA